MLKRWFNKGNKPMVSPFLQSVFRKRFFPRDQIEVFGRQFERQLPHVCQVMMRDGIPHHRIANVLDSGMKHGTMEVTEMRIAYVIGIRAFQAAIEGWKVYK